MSEFVVYALFALIFAAGVAFQYLFYQPIPRGLAIGYLAVGFAVGSALITLIYKPENGR